MKQAYLVFLTLRYEVRTITVWIARVVDYYFSLVLLFVLCLVLVAAEIILDRLRSGAHCSHKCVRFVASRTAERECCRIWRMCGHKVGA